MNNNNNKVFIAVIGILSVIALGSGFLAFKFYQSSKGNAVLGANTSNTQPDPKAQEVKNNISKEILVPSEEPTIASIVDINKLKQQNAAFYADAQNGDYLVLYSTKAIVYRLEENKIINVLPIAKSTTPATNPPVVPGKK